ncbi:chloride channel [Morchella snyderi]|nr:chloride channel [Morchella snyderi]
MPVPPLLSFASSTTDSSRAPTPPDPPPQPPTDTDADDPVRASYLDSGSGLSFKRRAPPSRYSLFPPTHTPSHPGPSSFPDHDDDGDGDGDDTPGRRVYDDLTAIDWIFEYAKERLRTRSLSGLGRLLDASQVWVVLLCTGVAAGMIAAAIDIATNWLGDLKHGYCGGAFYLSRRFCCLGLDAGETCTEWVPWRAAVGAARSAYVVEYFFYIVFSILFAVTASVLVGAYAIYAKHSGIPEIKTVLGGFVIRRFMGAQTLIIKSLGLCLAVASGLWLGKEGPLVHVACCCANILMKPFPSLSKNEARKREVLSAASAAGISVAFGSPIGGVLFSLEQLSYYFPDKAMWQSFVSAMVAAVTLQFMNPFRTGKLVLYQVKYTRGWHDFEIIPFAVLGVIGGLYGAFFIRLNMRIAQYRKTTIVRKYPVTEVTAVALVTALINFPIIFMRPSPSALVAELFQECSKTTEDPLGLCVDKTAPPIILLLLSSVLGVLLASATFGLQVPAGIILPSMAIGALYGRSMGMALQAFQRTHPSSWLFTSCTPDVECVTPGVFAIIGAASALGGVTRMTVSIVVIMFELTGALTYVLPIMIAVMLSKWVGDAFGKRGIYESWIRFKQYPFLDNREDPVPDVAVSEVMTRTEDLVVITERGNTLATLDALLATQQYKGFPVVTDTRDAVLVGYISRSELRCALDQVRRRVGAGAGDDTECVFGSAAAVAGSPFPVTPRVRGEAGVVDLRAWMDATPITLAPGASLLLVAGLFQKLGLRYVVFARHGVLQGLLTKKDVFEVLNGEEEGEAAGRLGGGGGGGGGGGEGARLLVEGEEEEEERSVGNLVLGF